MEINMEMLKDYNEKFLDGKGIFEKKKKKEKSENEENANLEILLGTFVCL